MEFIVQGETCPESECRPCHSDFYLWRECRFFHADGTLHENGNTFTLNVRKAPKGKMRAKLLFIYQWGMTWLSNFPFQAFVYDAVDEVYKDQQLRIVEELKTRDEVHLCGDGRFSSPGG